MRTEGSEASVQARLRRSGWPTRLLVVSLLLGLAYLPDERDLSLPSMPEKDQGSFFIIAGGINPGYLVEGVDGKHYANSVGNVEPMSRYLLVEHEGKDYVVRAGSSVEDDGHLYLDDDDDSSKAEPYQEGPCENTDFGARSNDGELRPVSQGKRSARAAIRKVGNAQDAFLRKHGCYATALGQLRGLRFDPHLSLFLRASAVDDWYCLEVTHASIVGRTWSFDTRVGQIRNEQCFS